MKVNSSRWLSLYSVPLEDGPAEIRSVVLVGGTPDIEANLSEYDALFAATALNGLAQKGVTISKQLDVHAYSIDPALTHDKNPITDVLKSDDIEADCFVFMMVPSAKNGMGKNWDALIGFNKTNHTYSELDDGRDAWRQRLEKSKALAVVTIGGNTEVSLHDFAFREDSAFVPHETGYSNLGLLIDPVKLKHRRHEIAASKPSDGLSFEM